MQAWSRSQQKFVEVPDTAPVIRAPKTPQVSTGTSTSPESIFPTLTEDQVSRVLINPNINSTLKSSVKDIYDLQQEKLKAKAPTPDEEKKQNAAKAISQLENIYVGQPGERSLAFAKEAPGGRLFGTAKNIQRVIAPGTFPESDRLNTYKRTLESIRPLLAKAAGDAGNLALQEQIMAGRGLPDESSTPEEALQLFKSMREKFGLETSDAIKQYENQLKGITTSSDRKNKSIGELLVQKGAGIGNFLLGGAKDVINDITAGITTKQTQDSAQQAIKSAQSLMNQAEKTTDLRERLRLINQARQTFQQVSEQQKGLQSMFSDQANTNPIVRGLILGSEVAGTAALATELPSILNRLVPATKQGVQGTVRAVSSQVTPAKAGRFARTQVIEKAEAAGKTVDGTKVFNAIKDWSVRAKKANPASISRIDKFVEGADEVFKGQKLTPTEAKSLWDDAYKGFTASGKIGNSMEASFHRSVRDILRTLLDEAAPGFEKETQQIAKGLNRGNFIKSLPRNAAVGAAGIGGTLYLLNLLRGRNQNQY